MSLLGRKTRLLCQPPTKPFTVPWDNPREGVTTITRKQAWLFMRAQDEDTWMHPFKPMKHDGFGQVCVLQGVGVIFTYSPGRTKIVEVEILGPMLLTAPEAFGLDVKGLTLYKDKYVPAVTTNRIFHVYCGWKHKPFDLNVGLIVLLVKPERYKL